MKTEVGIITCRKCRESIWITAEQCPEGLEAKPEQMQSSVRQQDAALRPDESSGSAAGNPDGDWIGEFEVWLDEQIEAADIHYRSHPDATTANLPIMLKMLRGKFQDYKRQGAA